MNCVYCGEYVAILFWAHVYRCGANRRIVTLDDEVTEAQEEEAREFNRKRDAHRKSEGFAE